MGRTRRHRDGRAEIRAESGSFYLRSIEYIIILPAQAPTKPTSLHSPFPLYVSRGLMTAACSRGEPPAFFIMTMTIHSNRRADHV